jgi:HTH-type transcriptional regulator/antitoxin HigA
MTNSQTAFCPDWVSPPGETILDLIEEKNWNQKELAQRMGYSERHLCHFIQGKVALTEDAALRLEKVLGSTANFWLNRGAKYQEHLARIELQKLYESENSLNWLNTFPIQELQKIGVLIKERVTEKNKPKLVESLLRFFGVASPEQWSQHYGTDMQLAFRRSRESTSDIGAVSSWLRLGEIQAEKLDAPKYDYYKFKKALKQIRELTVQTPDIFHPEMHRLCYESGVMLVFVPAIPKAHVSGVARWLNNKPLIQLSLYGKTNDKFWFTFFHEAAHILLHANPQEKKEIYLDDLNGDLLSSEKEIEANSWAGNFLISAIHNDKLQQLKTKVAVTEFAEKIGIHAGIIVGRLQHDKIIEPSWMNDLKAKFEWVEPTENQA